MLGSLSQLYHFLRPGVSRDVLEFLFATALFVPTVKLFKTSPIIGFLLMGMVLGPSGLNLFHAVHVTQQLAEFGIIFFLFEMGLELSVEKVISMKFDVFVLGMLQYVATGAAVAFLAQALDPALAPGALVVLGGALALSSSAFVLQLIRDRGQLGTRYGRASFGVLLFQDLAVVPLLVVVPLLAGSSGGLLAALGQAAGRAALALAMIFVFGHVFLDRVFMFVTRSQSPEAFLSVTLGTVILCSAVTEGLGLSNTLGAFLGGVLLSETHYRHQVEADIAPFRGLLLGLFFVTVGFSIDLRLLASSWTQIVPVILVLLGIKTAVVGLACALARLPFTASVQSALVLAPGGEFAFVVLGLAEKLSLLSPATTQILVTATALSMALTPLMAKIGESLATSVRTQKGFESYEGKDSEGSQIVAEAAASTKGFVVVCGFGRIGRTICQLLDAEGAYDYIAFDNNPAKAIQARSMGLPVFLADCSRREVLESFKVGSARLVVIAMGKKEETNLAAEAITRQYPDVPVLVRARDGDHQEYLLRTFGLDAVVPVLPPDSILLSLPFGGEVLRRLGYEQPDISGLMEEMRRQVFAEGGLMEAPVQDKALADVFATYDTDGNGEIDASELKSMLESLGKEVSNEQVAQIMLEADVDGSDTITLPEFKRMVTNKLFKIF